MTTTSLNALWAYLQSLSLTQQNKEWLVSKLTEPSHEVSDNEKEALLWKEYCETFSAKRDNEVMTQFISDVERGNALQDCMDEEQVFEQLGL